MSGSYRNDNKESRYDIRGAARSYSSRGKTLKLSVGIFEETLEHVHAGGDIATGDGGITCIYIER